MDVQIAEARAFYAFQTMIEQVHSETYSLLIETYVRDTAEKDFLFKGMENSVSKFPALSTALICFSPLHPKEGGLGTQSHNRRTGK